LVAASAAIVALGVALVSTNADAISSYTSTSMSCGSIKATIRNQGAVILRWTSSRTGNANYNRFVRNANYCNPNQTTRAKSVPASDTRRCSVQYCVSRRAYDSFD
jgi:hypothetical protein